jgi:hypothetical protein
MREAYFHEDDYCQTELLPIANHKHCRDQLGEIESFSAKHESEFGWTDMYVRPDAAQTLADTRIGRIELQRVLGQFLPTFDRVITGYSIYKEPCQNTTAFGADTNLILFAAHDGDFIAALWLTIQGLSEHDIELASRMFQRMSQWGLLLVDWSMSALVALDDPDAVGKYLAEFRAAVDS